MDYSSRSEKRRWRLRLPLSSCNVFNLSNPFSFGCDRLASRPEVSYIVGVISTLWRGAGGQLETGRRVVLVLALCLWFGGFTFYALVVIHTGHHVFPSRVEVGFLTQAVTRWLNLIGVGALCLMLWNVFADRKRQGRLLRGTLVVTWLVVAGIELVLFILHPKLDTLLNPQTHSIVSRSEFKSLHLLYMNLSTTQWIATIIYICATLWAWRCVDRSCGAATELSAANKG